MPGKIRRRKTRVHASAPRNVVERRLKNNGEEMETVSRTYSKYIIYYSAL